jgi:hypothetical protein
MSPNGSLFYLAVFLRPSPESYLAVFDSFFDRMGALMFHPAWTHPRASWLSLAVAAAGLGAVGAWLDLSPRVESDFFFSKDDP